MPGLHTEIHYEDELVGQLVAKYGWLEGTDAGYDKDLALYTEDVIGWIQDTQPKEYAKVKGYNNGATDRLLLERLAKTIELEGTHAVLRNGFKRTPASFEMCAFKPTQSMNPTTLEKYGKVRCRVVRQVHYSKNNKRSIDVVLFINGIPVATIELKTDNTQSVEAAMTQYRDDRPPKDEKTGRAEPLLTFKRGALVHFAASTDEIHMTTELAGKNTSFLPFNLGDDEGKGNPPNPDGFRTAYFYQRVLQRDAWLNIVDRFIHVQKFVVDDGGKKRERERIVFPRYHQWDVVTKLVDAAKDQGTGHNYLIQHSAGSGKSNSIMWLAHRLSGLHDAADKRVFDSVIIVTDRNVLDDQLQKIVSEYEHKDGQVVRIKKDSAKTPQLVNALKNRTPIILVTIQTFPHAMIAMKELADIGKRSFAVIADEAHSSQTGKSATGLKEMLGAAGIVIEGDDVSAEDLMLASQAARAKPKNVSYFAFTATPKAKTLEMFGTPVEGSTQKKPFHIYSMRQAIEEGFILDVLQNYTPYSVAYRLANTDPTADEMQVPKGKAAQIIARAAKLHDASIAKKVEIVVEHYREMVQPLLNGKAKAMVVCDSRKAAVKYKLAIDKYIKSKSYPIATLVAFSGDVADENDWPGMPPFSESNMNKISGKIPEAFATDAYQVLLVAEKYQTGFDQPLLSAMYVDKKLAGIAAVQTLSRLNRTYKRDGFEKTETFVLDFVNDGDDILKAFQQYYKTATLASSSDPDQVHDLQNKLDKAGVYYPADVEAYYEAYTKAMSNPKGEQRQSLLKAVLDPIVDRYRDWLDESKRIGDAASVRKAEEFREDVATFVRAFGFLSQIYNYESTDLEKRSYFYAGLARLIRDRNEEAPLDLSSVTMTHHKIESKGKKTLQLDNTVSPLLAPMGVGGGKAYEKEFGPLAEVVRLMNELLGDGIDEDDVLDLLKEMEARMIEDPILAEQAKNNSPEQFINAGNVIRRGEEELVNAKEHIVGENERQNATLEEALDRVLGDKEGRDRVMRAMAFRVYNYHQDSPGPAA
jgi:type I restriction enzyme R subunit